MAERDRPHIRLTGQAQPEPYRPHGRKIPPKQFPAPSNRQKHAAALTASLRRAEAESRKERDARSVVVEGTPEGLYLEVSSPPGVPLKLESLEDRGRGIELLAASVEATDDGDVERATLFVPDGAAQVFYKKLDEYTSKTTRKGEPWHKPLLDRVQSLRLATLEALWTEDPQFFPSDGRTVWWEVWLRRSDGGETARFREFAREVGLDVAGRILAFDERTVVLVFGSVEVLSASLAILGDIAELRKPSVVAGEFVHLNVIDQEEWLRDLALRIAPRERDDVAVCLLDTGVNIGHPLLEGATSSTDARAADPAWGSNDHHGHGTEMAGLALLGDLAAALASQDVVPTFHRLESVKILPPVGVNVPDAYGTVTAYSASLVEAGAPKRRRCFSLAITAPSVSGGGQPTAWSAAVDALAAGRDFDTDESGLVYLDDGRSRTRRLYVVATGNKTGAVPHPDACDLAVVEDPAQAWNALTVGASTHLGRLDADDQLAFRGYSPIAAVGDVSPYSRTSVTFAHDWPLKPDVVFEGGNALVQGKDVASPDSTSLLTTGHRHRIKPFQTTCGTSAATSQVSRIAGALLSEYDDLWPESVRALLVNSARWTSTMRRALPSSKRRDVLSFIRRYGFGEPSLERARYSANNELSLVCQDVLHPFVRGTLKEMNLHELPWPAEALEGLGARQVTLRVTLSYFVDPHPARRGWRKRYSYASHGFRFSLALPTEDPNAFRKRVNAKALAEAERKPTLDSDAVEWMLGEANRTKGSLHHDIWTGSAADLAERRHIAVWPVTGWWKENPRKDRSHEGARYSLVVTIEAPEVEVDLWTPVANQVGIPIPV